MRRIYTIRATRILLHSPVVKAVLVLMLLWRSTKYVSYAHVFENAPHLSDVPRGLAFLVDAVQHTEATTLMILASVCVIGVWAIVDSYREEAFRQNEFVVS